jgi:hypothetical protein
VPLHCSILHQHRLVVVVAGGTVGYEDVQSYLDAVNAANAVGYRTLFDARQGTSQLSDRDLMTYAGTEAALASMAPLGPFALIAGETGTQAHARLFHALAATTRREFQAFASIDDACDWLLKQRKAESPESQEVVAAARDSPALQALLPLRQEPSEGTFRGRRFDLIHDDRALTICVVPVDEAWELWLCEQCHQLVLGARVPIDDALDSWKQGVDPMVLASRSIVTRLERGDIVLPSSAERSRYPV